MNDQDRFEYEDIGRQFCELVEDYWRSVCDYRWQAEGGRWMQERKEDQKAAAEAAARGEDY